MTKSGEVALIGLTEGLVVQRSVEMMLEVLALTDAIQQHAPDEVGAWSGRTALDISVYIEKITGIPSMHIRSLAERIRMHQRQEKTEDLQRISR